jgi:hypothetical protein
MANQKELTLAMKIKANAAQAREEIAKVAGDIKNISGKIGSIGSATYNGGRSGLGALGKMAGIAVAPLKILGGLAAVVGGATAGLGLAAINAAGDYESLQLRLEAVMATAKDAKKAFDETIKFANQTPFEAEDLINSRIVLEGIGIKGPRALKSTANAAAAMGRQVSELASVVASLETEPLRRLGIGVAREGDHVELTFRDKMGRLQKIVADGAMESRQALLKVFDIKFTGATDKLGGSWKGIVSTMGDTIKAAFASFGKGLLPAAKKFITFLSEGLGSLIESGKIEEIGRRAGAWLLDAVNKVIAGVMVIPQAAEAFSQTLAEAPGKMGELLGQVLTAAASIFVNTVVESWIASANMFKGIGKILAAAFMEEILQLPLMGNFRQSKTEDILNGMTPDERREIGIKHGINTARPAAIARKMTAEQQAAFVAQQTGDKAMKSAMAETMSALPDALQRVKDQARTQIAGIGTGVFGATGFDVQAAYAKNLSGLSPLSPIAGGAGSASPSKAAKDDDGIKPAVMNPYTRQISGYQPLGGKNPWVQDKKYGTEFNPYTREIRPITVQNLTIQTNDARNMQDEIMRRSGQPNLAPAGT